MSKEALKLTVYFGERDRAGDGFLSDALVDLYAAHEFQTSLVMRGVEGFGAAHGLHSDRLLTLSEDLPLASVAVDARERIEAAIDEVTALSPKGLVTLERARLLTGGLDQAEPSVTADEATKLTVYLGRRAGHRAVVELLHRSGVAGATVLFGIDGTAHRRRERARFFGANARVPLMVIAVGEGDRIAAVLPELAELLDDPLVTLERVQVCKRDGSRLADPRPPTATDPSGLAVWQKLMVYTGEQDRHGGQPLHRELIHRLRREGAMGATCLRGIWGYHGDHLPHGDSFWQLRRRVPVVTVVIDRPDRTQRWFEIVDELTAEAGLVTSEMVRLARPAALR